MNPAQRLSAICSSIQSFKSNQGRTLQAWIFILKIDDRITGEKEAGRVLSQLHDQVGLLRDLLAERAVPESLYSSQLSTLDAVFGITSVNAAWPATQSRVTPEVRMVLKWADWYLGDLDGSIPDADREAIAEEIADLEAALNSSDLSPALFRFMQQHLQRLKEAFSAYDISGSEPLERALDNVRGDCERRSDALSSDAEGTSDAGRSLMQRFKNLVDRSTEAVNSTGKFADSGMKIAAAGAAIAKAIGWIS
ncbi:hypothetical protein [Bordetella sp. LUAb4]|uniref:hypothetical protein n=1 Tax=Bordetella sp. LUAb4 TaxID=2843195 RepID=UPI001E4881B8|nr:hypothetical protein [Bordetella sp. LUAb4]